MDEPAPMLAPIIVTAVFRADDQAWFDAQRAAHFPPERNHLSAHLTLFHHLAPSLAREVAQRLAAETRGIAPLEARIAGTISLGGGVAYRIDCAALAELRGRLVDAFAGTLTPQDRAGWRPHVTIQNKVEPAVAAELRARLDATFRPRATRIAALAGWWYRGGPWEPLSRHPFG